MKTKLVAIMIALFVVTSCGLDTEGLGAPDEGTLPDVSDDAEPDIGPDETEGEDTGEDERTDETEPDETSPDEAAEDVMDIPEDAEPEDAIGDEAADEAGDEGGEAETEDGSTEDGDAEDGETDPCALPEIPATGIFIFYCFFDYPELMSPMHLWLEIERGGTPVIPWGGVPGCSVTTRSHRLECALPVVWSALYKFNIELDPGVGVGWSCGPFPNSNWGTPRVWLYGVEITVTPLPFDVERCYHSFETPTP